MSDDDVPVETTEEERQRLTDRATPVPEADALEQTAEVDEDEAISIADDAPEGDALEQARGARQEGEGSLDRARGSVERGVEAVAGRIDLGSVEPMQRIAHDRVMPLEKVLPLSVPHLGGPPCGTDDVGEQHGREHGAERCGRPFQPDEIPNLLGPGRKVLRIPGV